ncbi:MAG: InlB B-repeat-containing protein, partial [Candidatus Bathyarchaeota archaeon]|uniref:dockerin type I domain-containing protein n=1 Tax=Candidatus Bathycorpusculum sp. TaxID=2994959 RepID=UPI00283A0640|nr:InlB B-repeat-containing protein [Candidatus Termiticorpusculum sp.]
MKAFHKWASVLLVICLMAGILPTFSLAQTSGTVTWRYYDIYDLETEITASATGVDTAICGCSGFFDSWFDQWYLGFFVYSDVDDFSGCIVSGDWTSDTVEVPYDPQTDLTNPLMFYGDGYIIYSLTFVQDGTCAYIAFNFDNAPETFDVVFVFAEPVDKSPFIAMDVNGQLIDKSISQIGSTNEYDVCVKIDDSYSGDYTLTTNPNNPHYFTGLSLDYEIQVFSAVECVLSSDARGLSKYRLEVEDSAGVKSYYNIWCEPDGVAPVLKNPSSPSATVNMYLGESYTVDLSSIFKSPINAELEYTVNMPSFPNPEPIPKEYTFSPREATIYTLEFYANDGRYISNAYTVTISVAVDMRSVKMVNAEEEFGQWSPLKSDLFNKRDVALVVPYGVESVDVVFTFSEDTDLIVFNGVAEQLGADKQYSAVLEVSLKGALTTIVPVSLSLGAGGTYRVVCYSMNYPDGPDSVLDYIAIGSQYTNGHGLASYGLRGVATLIGNSNTETGVDSYSAPASLGNFGGYIVYYFEDAIFDDPRNPYGVDFIIFGNSVTGDAGFAEPGQVWVSEDGNNWFALAGALHYDNSALWDYSITYEPYGNGLSRWTDSLGNSVASPYFVFPTPEYYPLHAFGDGEFGAGASITLSGILLLAQAGNNEYGNTLPEFPHFGYADVGLRGTVIDGVWLAGDNTAGNPYQGPDSLGRLQTSDGMSLAWAVDANGYPVTFPNGVHYVKVVTATNIDNGAIGEKSTEINMLRVAKPSTEDVGLSTAPLSITIGGVDIALSEGLYQYNAVVNGAFSVEVDAPGANVYVNSVRLNNEPGGSVSFAKIPDHGIIRVIVQDGDKAPRIYYVTLTDGGDDGVAYSVIRFDAAGGVVNGKVIDEKVYLSTNPNTEFPVPMRDRYIFLGWYDNNNVQYNVYSPDMPAMVSLTAKWERDNLDGESITVSFRLIGSTLSEGDVDFYRDEGVDYKGAEYQTWIATKTYMMSEGDTVYDLFVLALADAGLVSVGAAGDYVRTITAPDSLGGYALSEMSNGFRSGWMYTVNGVHVGLGLTNWPLADGDEVVWHYVNDYLYEVSDWFYGTAGDASMWSKWLETLDVDPLKPVVYGDVNGDGVVNRCDQTVLNQYFSGTLSVGAVFIMANADVNGDGVFN